ncbi:hypothetical protein Cadr_000022791 [Camelus dromedarius]|uniref:Uncharacterized protein n=1 Tax=Camelus dromedarius TaxID=9838 RepID=A0A5N4CGM3_CAMDR|nr:hypothetical protein Cadr_000022791 [Camelus dromedarius]
MDLGIESCAGLKLLSEIEYGASAITGCITNEEATTEVEDGALQPHCTHTSRLNSASRGPHQATQTRNLAAGRDSDTTQWHHPRGDEPSKTQTSRPVASKPWNCAQAQFMPLANQVPCQPEEAALGLMERETMAQK